MADLKTAAKKVRKAWESLGEGHYPPKVIEEWLVKKMLPAMRALRKALDFPVNIDPESYSEKREKLAILLLNISDCYVVWDSRSDEEKEEWRKDADRVLTLLFE